ncbi:amidohydrolase 2 [Corynespora cassiicola Philippines]|uniref:6-methylsalicylate decarboxylase n=1 Tax=Corynespora cassiicola Philippines TaxID=1448308 RepID=A0A2T2PCE4_CORCC|nr:amidohydrolase 2 [Corynespora cassiicola Philippines]
MSLKSLLLLALHSTAMANRLPPRIDVHSHFLPPDYHTALVENGHEKVDGMPAIPPWSVEAHLEMMEINNVSKSILSISSPGTHIVPGKDALGKNLTRHCNSYAAGLKKKYPDKFGFWASLPLPDVEAALEEIDKAVEEGCDGFAMLTNYHGNYMGASALDPVLKKLNEIGATVFIHPTKPCIKHGAEVSSANTTDALPFGDQYPIPMFEFLFDTARSFINLFLTGTVERCPNITFIIPHVGGAMPPIYTRFISFAAVVPGGRVFDPKDIRRQLDHQFYFDLAGLAFDGETGGDGQLKAFVKGFDISYQRLLYGSDFPFTKTQFVKQFADRMKDGLEDLFDECERDAIYEKNAIKLLEDGAEKRAKL